MWKKEHYLDIIWGGEILQTKTVKTIFQGSQGTQKAPWFWVSYLRWMKEGETCCQQQTNVKKTENQTYPNVIEGKIFILW